MDTEYVQKSVEDLSCLALYRLRDKPSGALIEAFQIRYDFKYTFPRVDDTALPFNLSYHGSATIRNESPREVLLVFETLIGQRLETEINPLAN